MLLLRQCAAVQQDCNCKHCSPHSRSSGTSSSCMAAILGARLPAFPAQAQAVQREMQRCV